MQRVAVRWPSSMVGLFPVPVTLVTCADSEGHSNVLTVGWIGVACSDPPMISMAIRPSRYSYRMIVDTGQFVINIPGTSLLPVIEYCGTHSGRRVDKLQSLGLTPLPASRVGAPIIAECPVNLECCVRKLLELGSHSLFLAEVVASSAWDNVVVNTGTFETIDCHAVQPVVASVLEYWSLGEKLGDVFMLDRSKM